MPETPRLGMTQLADGQALPEGRVNENDFILEFFSSGSFKSRTTLAEPVSPTNGDGYLVPASATGTNWTGQDGKIALFINTAWRFFTAKEGMTFWVEDEDVIVAFSGAAWGTVGASGESTDSQIWTGSDTATRISPRRIFTAAAPIALTDGTSIAIDGNTGINFKVTLAGNRTLANPTNMKTGQSGIIIVTQDATGSRTLAYGSNWRFPGGSAAGGVLSTSANAVDVISYFVRSDGTILATLNKAFAA